MILASGNGGHLGSFASHTDLAKIWTSPIQAQRTADKTV